MNPASPHPVPQEFLIFQAPPTTPTKSTAWLIPVPQLLNTPDLQGDQLVASTVTETGELLIWLVRPLHPEQLVYPEILQAPPWTLQAWSLATQGQADEVVIPLAWMQVRAEWGHPPLHPWFPWGLEQSTSCCSARLVFCPLKRNQDSSTPTAEKAQHEPHCPWFFTGVTFPWEVQSTSPTTSQVLSSLGFSLVIMGARNLLANSSVVKTVNWLTPILQVWVWSALCLLIWTRFFSKISLLYASSSGAQLAPYWPFHSAKASTLDSLAEQQTARMAIETSEAIKSCFPIRIIMPDRIFNRIYVERFVGEGGHAGQGRRNGGRGRLWPVAGGVAVGKDFGRGEEQFYGGKGWEKREGGEGEAGSREQGWRERRGESGWGWRGITNDPEGRIVARGSKRMDCLIMKRQRRDANGGRTAVKGRGTTTAKGGQNWKLW